MASEASLPPGTLPPHEVVTTVETALEFLRARGLRPTGRFQQFLSILRDHQEGKSVDRRLLPIAFQDTYQLSQIAQQFGDCDQSEFENKLRLIISDPAHPEDSRAETPGRDAQFELFLASQLKARGAGGVFFEEPDVVIEVGGLFFGFAAKRPKNRKRIRERLRGAFKQLRREGANNQITHGLAALDLTFLANPQGLPVVPNTETAPASAAMELVVLPEVRYIVETDMLSELLGGKDLRLTCGVLLFGAITAFLPDVGGVVNRGNFQVLRLDPTYRGALDLLNQTLGS